MRAPLLLALLLALAACDTGYVEPPPSAPALLPLDVGRAWVFERTRTDAEGTVVDAGLDTLRVLADTLVADQTWYRLEATSFDGGQCLTGYYTTRDGDVWYWPNPSEGAPYRQYLYPATAGTSYPYEKPDATATATVEGADVSQTVPAGTFTTYRYSIDYDALIGRPVADSTPPITRHLAPGVGFVRFESAYYALGEAETFYRYAALRWDLAEVIAP